MATTKKIVHSTKSILETLANAEEKQRKEIPFYDYKEQYKSPKWQKKRLEIMERDEFKCQKCNCEDNQLNVHHRFYIKGRKVWEYDNDVLITLCEKCHEEEHSLKKIHPYVQKIIDDILSFDDMDISYFKTFIEKWVMLQPKIKNKGLIYYLDYLTSNPTVYNKLIRSAEDLFSNEMLLDRISELESKIYGNERI